MINTDFMKRRVRSFLNHFGYDIFSVPNDGLYERAIPHATYAPWKEDALFLKLFQEIINHTLVDKYRCYELWNLTEQTAKLSEGALIEIGVWRGGTGALIAKQAQKCNISSSVYLCDTFEGVVKAGDKDPDYNGAEHSDTSRKKVENLLQKLSLNNVQILEGIFPDETADQIKEKYFRFCHIDVDVYESAKDIFFWIWEKMLPGGIIVFDDYGFNTCEGIQMFVNEQRKQKDLCFIHNLNGHAIFIKNS